MLQHATACDLVGGAKVRAGIEPQPTSLGLAMELEEDRDLDRTSLREGEGVVDAEPLATAQVDHRSADDAGPRLGDADERSAKSVPEDPAVGSLRLDRSCSGQHGNGGDDRGESHRGPGSVQVTDARSSVIPSGARN